MPELEIIKQLSAYGVTAPGALMLWIMWKQYETIQALKMQIIQLKTMVDIHDDHIKKER